MKQGISDTASGPVPRLPSLLTRGGGGGGGGAQIFQKPKRHLNILGAKIMTRNKFRTDGTQVLGAIVQNLVAPATWRPGYVHSSPNQWDKVVWTGK